MTPRYGSKVRLADGRLMTLGGLLGQGGEGSVFEVAADTEHCIKLYSGATTPKKARKLARMAKLADTALQKVAAWPIATVHNIPDGTTIGFMMPRLKGFKPIHELYTPASRKRAFEKADWKFLVHAARNLAAAFATVHSKNCVVGDVNQGNVWVHESQATCALIDCDSFQIQDGNDWYLCEVGVGHFTPPELQSLQSFAQTVRTVNHDAFGLAILVFHLLLFGRHPFAGLHAGKQEFTLEDKIARHWFAYGSETQAKGIRSPPGTLPLTVLGQTVANLFERSFSSSTIHQRPSPAEWIQALSALESTLKRCAEDGAHVYPGHLRTCPWCALEEKTATILFVSRVATATFRPGHFDIGVIWAQIERIQLTPVAPPPTPQSISAAPDAVPLSVQAHGIMRYGWRVIIIALAIVTFIAAPAFWWLIFIGAAAIWNLVSDESPAVAARRHALQQAEKHYGEIVDRWNKQTQAADFQSKRRNLEELKAEHQRLPQRYQAEMGRLKAEIRQSQLRRFLERFAVDHAEIPGVGESRKQTLISFGIDSAAEVTTQKILGVPGFGNVLTQRMIDWRQELEKGFRFDSTQDVAPQEKAALNRKIEHQKRQIEESLLRGANELMEIKKKCERMQSTLYPSVKEAAAAVAKARANLSAVSR